MLSVMRNVSQPFGDIDPDRPDIAPTRWRTVSDLTNLTYYFESATSPSLIWVKLKNINFSKDAPVRKLDLVENLDRVGDTTTQFKPAKLFAVPPPDIP